MPGGAMPTIDEARRQYEENNIRVKNLRTVLGASRSWCGLDGARWRPGFPIPKPKTIVLELSVAEIKKETYKRVVDGLNKEPLVH